METKNRSVYALVFKVDAQCRQRKVGCAVANAHTNILA